MTSKSYALQEKNLVCTRCACTLVLICKRLPTQFQRIIQGHREPRICLLETKWNTIWALGPQNNPHPC